MFQIGPNKSSTVTQSTSITITPTSATSIGKYSYEYYLSNMKFKIATFLVLVFYMEKQEKL